MIESDFFAMVAAKFPALPVAYPGVSFEPPSGAKYWLECDVFENKPIGTGLANDSRKIPRGIVQVTVCTRPGAGVVGLREMAEKVAASFHKGTVFSGNIRTNDHPEVLRRITQDDRIMLPVSMSYSQ